MTDDEAPRRKRGRPPKAPEDLSNRPTVALRVRPELHAAIVEAAKNNNRTLAQEMEFRLEEAFSGAHAQAVREAVDAALWQAGEEQVVEAGGKLGYALNSMHRRHLGGVLLEAHEKFKVDSAKSLTQEFIDFVFEQMRMKEQKIKEEWTKRIVLTKIVSSWDEPEVQAAIAKVSEDNPDLWQAFIEKFCR